MNKKEIIKKRIDDVQKTAVTEMGKNVNLPKDKSDQRVTHSTKYLHKVINLYEFSANAEQLGFTKRVHVVGGENVKVYQRGLVKLQIKDEKGNPVSAYVHGDVLIYAISQLMDPGRLKTAKKTIEVVN